MRRVGSRRPNPVVVMKSWSAAPRPTTFVSPVTTATPAARAAAPIERATCSRTASGRPSSRISETARAVGIPPIIATSLTVPWTASEPMSPPGKNSGDTTNALHLAVRVAEEGGQRGRDEDVADQDGEVRQLQPGGVLDGEGVGGRGCLEADGQEHHLSARLGGGDPDGVHRGVHRSDVRSARPEGEQVGAGAGDAQHVAETGPVGLPEPGPGRMQEGLPRLRPGGVREGRAVVAPVQPIAAGLGLDAPAVRQLVRRGQLGEDDRAVPGGGPDHGVSALPEGFDQRGEAVLVQFRERCGGVHRAVLDLLPGTARGGRQCTSTDIRFTGFRMGRSATARWSSGPSGLRAGPDRPSPAHPAVADDEGGQGSAQSR